MRLSVLILSVAMATLLAAGAQAESPGPARLFGVAATSSTNAWAVGEYFFVHYRALIERWDGMVWTKQVSPNLGGDNHLAGVAATSSTNAWAVGYYFDGTNYRTLIERWDGTEWSVQPSPNPGGADRDYFLLSVAATSDTNAWAVGYSQDTDYQRRSIVLHWNGTVWTSQPRPRQGYSDWLTGVAAIPSPTSSVHALAVGNVTVTPAGAARTLIEQWDGTTWSVVPSPNPGGPGHNFLFGVAATSSTNAWAVGYQPYALPLHRTIILRWNGTHWVSVGSGLDGGLLGVAATSSTNAWTVGFACTETFGCWDLVERWSGRAGVWSPVDVSGEFEGSLEGVAIASPNSVWVVGYYDLGPGEVYPHADAPLILQWDGTTWKFYDP